MAAAKKKKKTSPKSKTTKATKAAKPKKASVARAKTTAASAKKKPAAAKKASSKKATKKAAAKKPARARGPKRMLSAAEELLLRLPPLADAQRDAFRDQVSDARCDELGARTRSDAVHRDAMAFLETMAPVLDQHDDHVRRYGKARFAWFVECVVELERARSRQAAVRDDTKPIAEAVGHATERARALRTDLKHVLRLLASDSAADEQEIEAAAGSVDDLVASLRGLAKLAERWLRRTDREGKALVASVDLRSGDVDGAWAAAEDLQDAIDRAAGRSPQSERDTVSVNRAEGRVLFEMRYAMRAFDHASESNEDVPKLVPGPGTRDAFRSGSNGKSAERIASVAPPPAA